MLQKARYADAAKLAAFGRLTAALAKIRVGGKRKCLVKYGREIAAVISCPDRRAIGHRRRRNEIAPADFFRRNGGDPRRFVHKALGEIGRFRAARAAVGGGPPR